MADERDARSSERIRRDLEESRAELHETVDALEDRLKPAHVADEVWNRLRRSRAGHSAGSVAGGLRDLVRDHPVPLALMAAGVAGLALANSTRASGVAARIGHGAARAGRSLGGAVSRAAGVAPERGRQVREGFRTAMDRQPLVIGAVVLALGLAGGLAAPAARRERD